MAKKTPTQELAGQLVKLLVKHGVRGVVNTLACVLEDVGNQGETLPYNLLDNAADPEGPVDPGDLENAAEVLRGDLW